MKKLVAFLLLAAGLLSGAARWSPGQTAGSGSAEIRLLVRADDMGAAHEINTACLESYRNGIARSVEVIVPGPWFLEAARLLASAPDLDVGVHLCLTSEWENVKWRPLTQAPSLVDRDGYFYPTTRQRADFPAGTGFLDAKPKLDEVERELVDLLVKLQPGTWLIVEHPAADTPEMRAIGHIGYMNVAADRAGVTRAFTSERVKRVIRERGIRLISYRDLAAK